MIDTDKYGDMTMKDITAPIDEETGESPQIPARWKVKLCWTGAYNIVGGGEVICNLTGNKDSANRKEWAELIADAPLLLAEVKRLRKQLLRGVEMMNMTPNQTKEARKNRAKNFEREVRRMIE